MRKRRKKKKLLSSSCQSIGRAGIKKEMSRELQRSKLK